MGERCSAAAAYLPDAVQTRPNLTILTKTQARRVELRASFDGMRQELEAEEAEIAAFRQDASPSEFEERVRAFDQRVRAARRSSQQASEALQAEFARARRRLAAAVNPILIALLEERRAEVVLDAKTVLLASDQLDVTADVIDRLAETEIDFGFDDAGEAAVE